ncbi:MAG: hypothetical protein K8S27_07220 [Candidatus Omnitrophica bacterium]|nr:hypothetical protein [Candidatus Omnitrophota bacterium]
MKKNQTLKTSEVQKTIWQLHLRISDRFPNSSLVQAAKQLHGIAKETDKIISWISSPNYLLRIGIYSLIIIVALVLGLSVSQMNFAVRNITFIDFIQVSESALNEMVFIVAGMIFLVTLENRRKRKRVISSINNLRSIAHYVDALQLTKDPDACIQISKPTRNSPHRDLNAYDLGRYLDYCSELLSLISKLGFLYVQSFEDPIANEASNDLESLTTGLSGKIWQKIMILRSKES